MNFYVSCIQVWFEKRSTTHREIFLNQTEINRKIVNTIWFRFYLIKFRKLFSACKCLEIVHLLTSRMDGYVCGIIFPACINTLNYICLWGEVQLARINCHENAIACKLTNARINILGILFSYAEFEL